MPRRTEALLLVGHGSQLNPEAAQPVYDHAEALRAMGAFDEVAVAFWKEEPPLRGALTRLRSEDVYVVPLLLAEGYFDRNVVPRELGLEGADGAEHPRRVRYCPPVGLHPALASVVQERAQGVLRAAGVLPEAAVLVLVGHGTALHEGSGATTEEVVRRIAATGTFRAVRTAYLDQSPRLDEVVGEQGGDVVIVPFFLAEGLHTRRTIPEALGLEGARTARAGAVLHYAAPVGTDARLPDVVLALAAEAGAVAGTSRPGSPEPRYGRGWDGSPGAAAGLGNGLLQVIVRPSRGGGLEVLHTDDACVPPHRLVPVDPGEAEARARRTAAGLARPLRAAPDLPRGWIVGGVDEAGAARALDAFYPADLLRREAWRAGRLPVVPWESTAWRQTGRYAGVAALEGPALRHAVRASCAGAVCLRTPLWPRRPPADGRRLGAPVHTRSLPGAATAGTVERAPCAEACTLFVSFARATLALERRWPEGGIGVRPAPSRPHSLLRQAARVLARSGRSLAGDFEDLLNPRRLRYVAERLIADARVPRGRFQLTVPPAERMPRASPAVGTPRGEAIAFALGASLGLSLGVEVLSELAGAGAVMGDVQIRVLSGGDLRVRTRWSGPEETSAPVRGCLAALERRARDAGLAQDPPVRVTLEVVRAADVPGADPGEGQWDVARGPLQLGTRGRA